MAAIVDERWMGKGWEIVKGRGLVLDRVFEVRQVASELEAQTALAAQDPPVKLNGRHNLYAAVTCDGIGRIDDLGPKGLVMRATYSTPEAGHHDDKTIPMLQRKPKVRWGKTLEMVDMERDADNRWVCNSAGFFPSTPLKKRVKRRQLFISRYEPYFDLAKANLFEDCVNSEPFWLGPMRVLKGQCILNTIIPPDEYDFGAEYLRIIYEFEFSTWAIEPYQQRMIDRCATGWASVGGTKVPGRFGVVASGEFQPADEEVLLDGTGLPVQAHWKVGIWNGAKMVGYSPTTPPVAAPSYAIADGAPAWIRKWRSCQQRNFSIFGFR